MAINIVNLGGMNKMKWVYWFVGFFMLWCLISAMWYVWGVRGLSTEPPAINGHENALAIVEILLMLLGAFLIGYLVAYYQQEEPLSAFRNAFRALDFKTYQQTGDLQKLENEHANFEQVNAALQMDFRKTLKLRDRENQMLSDLIGQHEMNELALRNELEALKPTATQLATEVAHLKFKLKQLEFRDQSEITLRAPKENEIDDLTQISGIGPVIARRLYAMGIYSFKQIGSLDHNTIGQIGKVLKYFPNRIDRDDWVGQARQYMAQR